MTAEQFTYWLQGFIEINDPKTIGEKETQIIKDHLATVFKKVTPNGTGISRGPYIQDLQNMIC
jgi:hypothetical protein